MDMINMTPAEAIIELNRCKPIGYMPTDWERRSAAVELAKAALEKAIPKAPRGIYEFEGVTSGRCDRCGDCVFRSGILRSLRSGA